MSDLVVLPGQGKSVRFLGLTAVYKLVGAETGGTFALVEHPIEPNALASTPHVHRNEDEYSYVLEGEVMFLVGERVIQAPAGTLLAKPRGKLHAFWNASGVPARVLEIISPAGFEKYFEERAELATAGVPPDDPRIQDLARKYRLELDRSRIPELLRTYHLRIPEPPR